MTETDSPDLDFGDTGRDFTAYKDAPAPMERIDHPGGFRAAFDLTDLGDAETARRLFRALGLAESDGPTGELIDLQSGEGDTSPAFVWQGDDLVLRTTKHPVTGKKNHYRSAERRRRHDAEKFVGRCGYIHLIGEEEAVREAVAEIRRVADFAKEHSVGEWRF